MRVAALMVGAFRYEAVTTVADFAEGEEYKPGERVGELDEWGRAMVDFDRFVCRVLVDDDGNHSDVHRIVRRY